MTDDHAELIALCPSPTLGAGGYAANTFQGILKGIPYIGASLEHFIYGPAAERRLSRIEATLSEVAATLTDEERRRFEPSEEFVSLLERVAEPLSKATIEESRRHFRGLLINGARLASTSREWTEADLAASLLTAIDAPGLAIVAALGRKTNCSLNERDDPVRFSVVSTPEPQVFSGGYDFDRPYYRTHFIIRGPSSRNG